MDLQAEHQPDILAGELEGGTAAEPYFCCEEDFGFEELFYQHWRAKHRPMCPKSNCKFSREGLTKDTKHNFLRHWATHFTALKAQTCSCTKCGRTFDNKSNMSRHQRNCAGLRTCDDHQSSGAHQAHVTPIFQNVLSETNVHEQQNEQYQLSANALLNAAGGLDNAQYPFDSSNDFAGLIDTPWSFALSPRDPSSRRPGLNMSGQDTASHLTTTGMQASSYDMTDFLISEMLPEVQPTITSLTSETGTSSQEMPSLQQNIGEHSTQPAADVWMQQPWTMNTPIGGHSNARSETLARGHKRRSSGSSLNSRKRIRSTESVVDILGKMQKYAYMIRSQKRDKDAKKALDRIRSILEAVRQPGPAYSQATHTEDQWNDLSTHLDSSNIVDVNRQRLIWSPNSVSKVNRHRDVLIYKDQWKITLATHTHISEENGSKATRSLSVLRVDPFTDPTNGSSFAVFLGREIDSSKTIRMHPAIFAYRHVPSDSVVFKLVEDDDIEGLRQLLAVQEATIRDVDEFGGSLLSYATFFASPLCCKFLIGNGADVDREERNVHNGRTSYPLANGCYNDDECPNGWLARSLKCREYLLEAGADPTLETDDGFSTLNRAIGDSTIVDPNESASLDLILKKGGVFFDPTTTEIRGQKVWLTACRDARFLRSPKVLQTLVDAGCNPKETDTFGWNGLFYCVLCARNPASSKEMEALLCLLRMPIDWEARNNEDLTVSDYLSGPFDDDAVGSYPSDLWRCARIRAGLANDDDSWTPRYTARYTPWHFRALLHLDRWNYFDNLSELLEGKYPLTDEEILCKQYWEDANSDGDDNEDVDGSSDEDSDEDIDEDTFEGIYS